MGNLASILATAFALTAMDAAHNGTSSNNWVNSGNHSFARVNPEPIRACSIEVGVRGAAGVETRGCGNNNPPTNAQPEREEIVRTAWRHAEAVHKQFRDNKLYDTLNITPQDVITAAEFDIKQVAVSVSMSGTEEIQNSGKERVIDWLAARVENAEMSMENGLSTDCYSSGTASGGKQIGGLQLIVADTPTNVVGGIDANTWTFWRNIVYDASSDGGAAVSSANIQAYMGRVVRQIVRGKDRPDLIIADNNYYGAYLDSLTAIQRINSDGTGLAGAGFTTLKYYGSGGSSDVVLDGGIGGGCPTDHMYFLNTKYLRLRPFSGRNMEVLGDDRYSVNQDAFVRIVGWAGNMTARGREFQGVLKA